jgi:hypothetical protein
LDPRPGYSSRKNGRRVPRPGTISADIYVLARKGLRTGGLPGSWVAIAMLSVHLFKIKRPERGNQLGNLWKKKRPYDAPGSTRPENS